MPRTSKLTVTQCEAARVPPGKSELILSDGQVPGLTLRVRPKGKSWFLRQTYKDASGRQPKLCLGSYAAIGLDAARTLARQHLERMALAQAGVQAHKTVLAVEAEQAVLHNFEACARAWLTDMKASGRWNVDTAHDHVRRMEMYAFPSFGQQPMSLILPQAVKALLSKLSAQAPEVGRKLSEDIALVFEYAARHGVETAAVAGVRVNGAMLRGIRSTLAPVISEHHAALGVQDEIDETKVGDLMRNVFFHVTGRPQTRLLVQMMPYVFQRSTELRHMKWADIDWDRAIWKPSKMKAGSAEYHKVPLPRQALDLLRRLQTIAGGSQWVFPGYSDDDKPLSENIINIRLRALGYDTQDRMDGITTHGFRALARTVLGDALSVKAEVAEAQLAHKVKDANGTAYNRTNKLLQRIEVVQQLADYWDALRDRRPAPKLQLVA